MVCGAPNVTAGKKYPFARVGVTIPGGLTLERRKSRGEVSEGMLCSARELGLANVEVVGARAEGWRAGLGACDVVTARALAALDILLEYAAPLLVEGGLLVAWKGRRGADEEAAGAIAAGILGMEPPRPVGVDGPGGSERHLYLSRKLRSTPPGYPRREGMARKRPLGGSSRA